MTQTQNRRSVTMYFDATCPFAWVTSRWLLEVEKVRDVEVNFAPMSLAVLNEGRDLDPNYMKMMRAAWAPALVAAAVAEQHPEKVGEYYTAVGTRIHDQQQGDKYDPQGFVEVIRDAVEEIGLPADFLAGVGTSPEEDDAPVEQLRALHDKGITLVGDEVGTPIVELGGRGFFGPVLTRIPRGEEAGELFDAAVTLGNYPHFFELKRSRTEGPVAEYA